MSYEKSKELVRVGLEKWTVLKLLNSFRKKYDPTARHCFCFVVFLLFFVFLYKLILVYKRRKWKERPWCYIVSSESNPKLSKIFMFFSVFEYYYQTTCVDLQNVCRTASLKGQSVSTVPGAQKLSRSFRRRLAVGQPPLLNGPARHMCREFFFF